MKYQLEKKELALKIRNKLHSENMSLADLGRELGVTRTAISITLKNLEKGRSITLETLLNYSKVLKIDFLIIAK